MMTSASSSASKTFLLVSVFCHIVRDVTSAVKERSFGGLIRQEEARRGFRKHVLAIQHRTHTHSRTHACTPNTGDAHFCGDSRLTAVQFIMQNNKSQIQMSSFKTPIFVFKNKT